MTGDEAQRAAAEHRRQEIAIHDLVNRAQLAEQQQQAAERRYTTLATQYVLAVEVVKAAWAVEGLLFSGVTGPPLDLARDKLGHTIAAFYKVKGLDQ